VHSDSFILICSFFGSVCLCDFSARFPIPGPPISAHFASHVQCVHDTLLAFSYWCGSLPITACLGILCVGSPATPVPNTAPCVATPACNAGCTPKASTHAHLCVVGMFLPYPPHPPCILSSPPDVQGSGGGWGAHQPAQRWNNQHQHQGRYSVVLPDGISVACGSG